MGTDLAEQEKGQNLQVFDYASLGVSTIDVDFLRSKETSMKARTHQVMVDNGRDLIEAKARVGHGAFETWCNDCLGIDRFRSAEFMRIADEFGKCAQCAHLNNLGKRALLLICKKDTPESAKEKILKEAEDGKVSLKRSQEIISLEKKLAKLQAKLDAKITPNLDKLVPRLKKLLNKEQITKRIALNYSQLSEDDQQAAASNEEARVSLNFQLASLERDKAKLAESATRAHEKADTMQAQFDEAVGRSTQEILAAKDREIDGIKKEIAQAKVDAREQLEISIRATVDREYQDEIIKARKDKEKAEKEKQVYQEKTSAMAKSLTDKDREIQNLKDQIEVDSPVNIDNSRALKMTTILKELDWNIPDIKKEVEIVGGGMHETRRVVRDMMEVLADLLETLEEQSLLTV